MSDPAGQVTFANDDRAKRRTSRDNLIVLAASYLHRGGLLFRDVQAGWRLRWITNPNIRELIVYWSVIGAQTRSHASSNMVRDFPHSCLFILQLWRL